MNWYRITLKLASPQGKRWINRKGDVLVARSEKRLFDLRILLIEQMEKIYLNNNRQEELIDQMYGLNRQIANVEGSLLRLAENCGIKRKEFITSWVGNEINHNWAINPGKSKNWNKFTLEHNDEIIEPENHIAAAIFNVKYSAKLCLPVENTYIICKINVINKVLISAENGPIICIIKPNSEFICFY